MNLDSSFQTLTFVRAHPVVYVIGIEQEGKFYPLYVGETGHVYCRYADYIRAQFAAETDFKVGEAIRYLIERGHKVLVQYKHASEKKTDRKAEEDNLKKAYIAQGFSLLEGLPGYSYRAINREERKEFEERKRREIREYVDRTLLATIE